MRERSEQDASANMLRQTVTLATAIFLYILKKSDAVSRGVVSLTCDPVLYFLGSFLLAILIEEIKANEGFNNR